MEFRIFFLSRNKLRANAVHFRFDDVSWCFQFFHDDVLHLCIFVAIFIVGLLPVP
jgi:hypothetical protein